MLAEQAGIVRAAVDAHGGQVVDTQGDFVLRRVSRCP
jgi:hypothetical protein